MKELFNNYVWTKPAVKKLDFWYQFSLIADVR